MQDFYWFEKLLDKLEIRYGRFAVKNLISYIVGFNASVYLLNYINPQYIDLLTLDMSKVLQGQIWRLFTYIFIPPPADIIFIIFALYLLYMFGTALEAQWGSFRINFYYLIGMISTTIIGACFSGGPVTNFYINTSIFLAFAAVFPDFRLYIFFILPVKVKYLAALTWAMVFLTVFLGTVPFKLLAITSVINFLLFFWPHILQRVVLLHRRHQPLAGFTESDEEPFHKCSVCGKTEKHDINIEFRVCDVCDKELCLEHLSGHEHK
ncbi:rhomboid family intramembrane serine protease [Candidatus Omnitrophota bacterium]